MILGFSDVTFCDTQSCKTVAPNLQFPNGLIIKETILYLPDSITGRLYIYRILPNKDLEKINEVNLGYGVDNASIDENGDIWIAAFPIGVEIFKAYDDPYNAHPPSAVLRVRKIWGEYVVEKVLEDAKGEVLPAATTVVHDARTGRLFLSSKSFDVLLGILLIIQASFHRLLPFANQSCRHKLSLAISIVHQCQLNSTQLAAPANVPIADSFDSAETTIVFLLPSLTSNARKAP